MTADGIALGALVALTAACTLLSVWGVALLTAVTP